MRNCEECGKAGDVPKKYRCMLDEEDCGENDIEYHQEMRQNWTRFPEMLRGLADVRLLWEQKYKHGGPRESSGYDRGAYNTKIHALIEVSQAPMGLMRQVNSDCIDNRPARIQFRDRDYTHRCIVMGGPPGVGKTFAMGKCFLGRIRAALGGGSPGRWWRSRDLAMRQWYGQEAQKTREGLHRCSLLCLDDLGAEPQVKGDVWLSEFEALCDERMNHDLPIWITTNLGPEDFRVRYGDRAWRRLDGDTSYVAIGPLREQAELPLRGEA